MGTKSHCSLPAYINIWKELLLSCLRDKAKIALFSKLSNLFFDLRPPTPGQDRGAKTGPLGQLGCANPRGSPGGMVRLGIDWYIRWLWHSILWTTIQAWVLLYLFVQIQIIWSVNTPQTASNFRHLLSCGTKYPNFSKLTKGYHDAYVITCNNG